MGNTSRRGVRIFARHSWLPFCERKIVPDDVSSSVFLLFLFIFFSLLHVRDLLGVTAGLERTVVQRCHSVDMCE